VLCLASPWHVWLELAGEQLAASLVTSKFKPPNELEFEKVYMPYILYSKKRYAGQMYTRPEKPDKIDIKGLQVST
jgi:DNA polymerase delta subunit 1